MAAQITKDNCDVLITAEEAFSAFEIAVLNAEQDIRAGFRVFDLMTTLRSDQARAVGDTWFDLLAHKLDQGVRVSLKLSDFDPIVRGDMHALTWRTLRQANALREVTRNPDNLTVQPSMHKARIGWLSAIGLWVKSRALISEQVARHNTQDKPERQRFLLERPGLRPFLRVDDAGKAHVRLWPPAPLVPATHHQKLAVIDAQHVYIGGLDLNDRRYDTKRHEEDAAQTWHDVQVMISDADLAQDALAHLDEFEAVIAGQAEPKALPKPFLRTISAVRQNPIATLAPDPKVRDIRQAHLDRIAAAQDLIYLETQFLRDSDVTQALCDAARRAPRLGLILILPAAPEEVAFENATSADARYGEYMQAKCLDRLSQAFGSRMFAGSPVKRTSSSASDRSTLSGAPLLYVHAKVSVFDDQAAIVSSANLNGRSLNWDTEAGVELTDPTLVRHLKARCIQHWLPTEQPDPYMKGAEAPQAWRTLAEHTAETVPTARNGFIVPYQIAPARRFGRNLPGVPEEMV